MGLHRGLILAAALALLVVVGLLVYTKTTFLSCPLGLDNCLQDAQKVCGPSTMGGIAACPAFVGLAEPCFCCKCADCLTPAQKKYCRAPPEQNSWKCATGEIQPLF